MAQWYAHLLFRGDRFLGEGLDDFGQISGVRPELEGEPYTAVVISGYALNGKLRGFYSLGVSHIKLDPSTNEAFYTSEESSLHKESARSLSAEQKSAVRDWLMAFDASAWEDSTEPFKHSLNYNGTLAEG